jgi:hypothetical protein
MPSARLREDALESEYFRVPPEKLETYGAFNVSLVADLPLFIDPFLLFIGNMQILADGRGGGPQDRRRLRATSYRPLQQKPLHPWFKV